MIIKNLSQLKKVLIPDIEFEVVLHNRLKRIGQIRRITKANTAGFYAIIASEPENRANVANNGLGIRCDWDLAKQWTFDTDGVVTKYTDYKDGFRNEIIIAFKILEGTK